MKIPETSANVGAYYGNEENGQWQPNGVMIDSGVGGGVVGSGDAGIHRPPVYPVHIPRGHIPGYVMAGAYYPPQYGPVPQAIPQDEFADYMWMENEEEFDKQVMQELEEEALMEQCIEAMLEDEQRERHNNRSNSATANGHTRGHYPTTSNGSLSLEETVSRSTLNPLAAEFVPIRVRSSTTELKQAVKEPPAEDTQKSKEEIEMPPQQTMETEKKESTTEEITTGQDVTPPTETPEVSAADVQPIDKSDKRKKDAKKIETKKPAVVKQEVVVKAVKAKPQAVKSEPKIVQAKRKEAKEVRPVRSEVKSETKDVDSELIVPPVETPKVTPPVAAVAPSVEEPAPTGPKPINYAAAAKANKPKKPTEVKTPTQAAPKIENKIEKKEVKVKTEKVVQRKNSTK